MQITFELELDLDVDYEVTNKGCPETPPAYSHGGLPAEAAELKILSVKWGSAEVLKSLSKSQREALEEIVHEHYADLM